MDEVVKHSYITCCSGTDTAEYDVINCCCKHYWQACWQRSSVNQKGCARTPKHPRDSRPETRPKVSTTQITNRCPPPPNHQRYSRLLCRLRNFSSVSELQGKCNHTVVFVLFSRWHPGKSWNHKKAAGASESHRRGLWQTSDPSRCGQKTGMLLQTVWMNHVGRILNSHNYTVKTEVIVFTDKEEWPSFVSYCAVWTTILNPSLSPWEIDLMEANVSWEFSFIQFGFVLGLWH